MTAAVTGPARPAARPRRRRSGLRVTAGCVVLLLVTWFGLRWSGWSTEAGDPASMAFGALATLFLSIAAAYAVRRRTQSLSLRWRLGTARTWLLLHLQCSVLFLLALVLHSGLRWPVGLLPIALWLLSLWTVASGVFGLVVQSLVPRALVAMTSTEVHFDRIPALVAELRQRAEAIAEGAEPAVRTFYGYRLAPVLAQPRRNPAIFFTSRRLGWQESLDHLRGLLDDDGRGHLHELEELVQAKADLDSQYALQTVLRTWQWLHVPPAILLAVLVVVHIGAVTYW